MRLIDKDKLLEELAERIASGTLQSFEELGDEIEDMEEEEAIPVDWLLQHIPLDGAMKEYNRKLVEYLVIGWKKENADD